VHDKSSDFLLVAIVQAVAVVILTVVLVYLFRATKHRLPEVPRLALVLAFVGTTLTAASGIASYFAVSDAADEFVRGMQTAARADEVVEGGAVPALAGLGLGAQLALGLAILLSGLNAMRAGLLSRFMGVVGIVVGALVVLPLGFGPILQLFWLGALAMLFLDRWPGGRGPAWETGEAVPWPSAAQRQGLAPAADGDDGEARTDVDAAEGEAPEGDSSSPRPRKRKRKRRR
jgi:hypothetical protein